MLRGIPLVGIMLSSRPIKTRIAHRPNTHIFTHTLLILPQPTVAIQTLNIYITHLESTLVIFLLPTRKSLPQEIHIVIHQLRQLLPKQPIGMVKIGHQQHKYHIHLLLLALRHNRIQRLHPRILLVQQKRKFLQIGLRHGHHPRQISLPRYRRILSLQIPQPPLHRVVIKPLLTRRLQSRTPMC